MPRRPQRPLRMAVAGAGMIARVHLDAARRAGATVVGLSASSAARARDAAAELGVPRAFASSEELVTSDDVDVVHICTPNSSHQPLASLALAAGKHVVCEKPLATTAEDADALAAAAGESGTVAAVPFVYRYHPMAAEARARVRAGGLGALRLIHGHYLQDWLSEPGDNNWRVDPVAGGASRAFADIGSHWCDLVEWVTGQRISELIADTQIALPQRSAAAVRTFAAASGGGPASAVLTEDAVQIIFRTDRGAAGNLLVSQISPGRKNRLWFELDGADASVTFDQENPESLLLGTRRGNAVLLRDTAVLSDAAARLSTLPAGHPMGYHDCFAAFVADVYRAVLGEAPAAGALPTFDDAARMARLTETVLQSARTRSWTGVR